MNDHAKDQTDTFICLGCKKEFSNFEMMQVYNRVTEKLIKPLCEKCYPDYKRGS